MGLTHRVLTLLAVGGMLAAASATEQTQKTAVDLQQMISAIAGGLETRLEAGEAPPLPKFEDVTKGMKSDVGLFTLWYYPQDAKDKDRERLLCQIPASFLGELFMLSTSISGGGFFTGFPLDERVVRWEVLDRQLLLVEPEPRYVVPPGKEVSDAVRRTYPERIRVAVPLLTKSPQGDPVIDLGPLLKSEFADIAWLSVFEDDGFEFAGLPRINPQLSRWIKKKAFELNVEIGVELAVARRSPPGSYDKKLIHYSFWKLPQTDYQPRIADDRVGYFLTTNRDWSKPVEEREIYNRYINRWHLVKRDPSLEKCEPRQPIVFYIEKTVPVRFRRAVRDGILEWNKAFERIGFVNAIEVRQQTDDNEWKDLDPEDMRYSFFRWIVTGGGFAIGPSRANPFTGQIYDADIAFDDSMVRYFQQDAERMLAAAAYFRKLSDPSVGEFIRQNPQWLHPFLEWPQAMLRDAEHARMYRLHELVKQRMQRRGQVFCNYCEGMKREVALAGLMLAGQPPQVMERFLYDVIKEVVMHEVGHTLGLRHNFAASSVYSLDEIRRRRTTGEPTCGSVMDYNPVLFFRQGATEGHFITPTLGPYDYWAIEYGYRPSGAAAGPVEKKEAEAPAPAPETTGPKMQIEIRGLESVLDEIPPELRERLPEILASMPPEVKAMIESGQVASALSSASGQSTPTRPPTAPAFAAAPAGEKAMLEQIAKRSTEPELLYLTDEDTTYVSPDPRTNMFDMSSDPHEWAKARIEVIDHRLANILEWGAKEGESWYFLRWAFVALMAEKAFVLDYVGRYIGGQYFSRAHRGDPNGSAPFVLVEPAGQRAALEFLEKTLYTDDFFRIPPQVLNHLSPHRWWHDDLWPSFSMDFPIHSFISLLQWWNLSDRLFPEVIRRIYDAELKTDAEDKLTAAEYLQRIQRACWSDATDAERAKSGRWSDTEPFLSSIRRSLQREYLRLVEPLVRRPPGALLPPDLHAMTTYSLSRLAEDLKAVLSAAGGRLDFASRAHLESCRSRIERMLSAELREREAAAGWLYSSLYGEPAQQR